VLIAVTAVAMGLRNATVRQLAVPDLTTTLLTLTLTGLAADSALAGGGNPRWVHRLASVASMFVGSVVGVWLVYASGHALPLVVAPIFASASQWGTDFRSIQTLVDPRDMRH
jgi:uncharacterized membrane protein YoaK (UPF0700 family)